MSYHHSNPARENEPHALPDIAYGPFETKEAAIADARFIEQVASDCFDGAKKEDER